MVDHVAILVRSSSIISIVRCNDEGVHVIPDSLGYAGGDSNSTVGGANLKHSQLSSEIVTLSPSIIQISETPPRNPHLGTSPYNPGLHVGVSPHNSDSGGHRQSPLHNSDPGTSPSRSSNSGASPHNLDSTKFYSGGESSSEGKTPNRRLRGAYAFAAALLDSTDDEEEGEEDVLPAKDGGKSRTEKLSSSCETESLPTCTCTSSKGEPSTGTCISPPLLFDSGEPT